MECRSSVKGVLDDRDLMAQTHCGRRHETSCAGSVRTKEYSLRFSDTGALRANGFLDGMGPCCSSRVPGALHTRWPHRGVAVCRHLDPAALEAHHQTARHANLCRVRVSGPGGAGPAPRHHEPSHGALGSARLHRDGKGRASQRTLGTTSLGHSKRHQGLR